MKLSNEETNLRDAVRNSYRDLLSMQEDYDPDNIDYQCLLTSALAQNDCNPTYYTFGDLNLMHDGTLIDDTIPLDEEVRQAASDGSDDRELIDQLSEVIEYRYSDLRQTREALDGWRPQLGIKRGRVIGVTGKTSSGKSSFLQYLLSCLILGREFLTTRKNKEKSPNILWCEVDGFSPYDFSSSLCKLFSSKASESVFDLDEKEVVLNQIKHITANYTGITKSGETRYRLRVDSTGSNQDEIINQLRDLIIKSESDIIVIDSLKGLNQMDENNASFADILREIADLALETNTLFFVLMHKSNKSNVMNAQRGTSAISDSVSDLWEIDYTQKGIEREISIKIEKSRSVVGGNKYTVISTLTNQSPEDELDPDFFEDFVGTNFQNYNVMFTECYLAKTGKNYLYQDGRLVLKGEKIESDQKWIGDYIDCTGKSVQKNKSAEYIYKATNGLSGYNGNWTVRDLHFFLREAYDFSGNKDCLLNGVISDLKAMKGSVNG